MHINGRYVEVLAEPHELLLDVLRDRLGLTGAKRSCDVQVCGACTVLVDGLPVSACTYLAYEANGRQVTTIEGLESPQGLHPLQEAFLEHAAVQCGFCTPGMILTALALLTESPTPDREAVRRGLEGTLCRCTGYWRIIEAVVDAGRRLAGAVAPAGSLVSAPTRAATDVGQASP
jgi:aerobic-type carbon monoxide dehydrogenase small subunit (CoxS/CutS family)